MTDLVDMSEVEVRPFRAPHHSVSVAGLVGGGLVARPGEVTLAHRGVLFLDELPEFKRPVLEALGRVIKERRSVLHRSTAALVFPADFQLVAAMQPCPCGYRGSSLRACNCTDVAVKRYRDRIPWDWFDLVVEVPAVNYGELSRGRPGEMSEAVRARVTEVRRGKAANTRLSGQVLQSKIDEVADLRLAEYLSRRGFPVSDAILRVARTTADLAGREKIAQSDVAEAIAFRSVGPPREHDGR